MRGNDIRACLNEVEYKGIMNVHWEAVKAEKCIRNLAKRKVTRVKFGGRSYIIKIYRRGIIRRALGLTVKKFVNLSLLDGLTPECVCERDDGNWQVVITLDAGLNNLFYLDELSLGRTDICGLFKEAGSLLAEMHRRGIFHGDTKSPNFVVNENCSGLPPVLIVDCDRIKYFKAGVPPVKQAFNLAQFIQSVRRQCPFDDAVMYLREFLTAYGKALDIEQNELRNLMILAFDAAENNGHIEKNTDHEVLMALRNTL